MTYTPSCATFVGARAKASGRLCGHAFEAHERHTDGAFVYEICRPCRDSGLRWTKELEDATGADHWYADGYGGRRTPDPDPRPPVVSEVASG